jgi:glycosyltransferase involved in cell wall biosynthesis
LLQRALESLYVQRTPLEQFEVIIVDNGSTDETRLAVEGFARRLPNLRYHYEARLGVAHARNRGWLEARGLYVGYLDDDAVAPPEWLDIAAEVIRLHSPDLFGGPFLPIYDRPKPKWFKDAYGAFDLGQQARALESHDEYLCASNLFVRRELFEQIGGFPSALGMRGRRIGYGEETAFIRRVRQEGPEAVIFYEPRMAVKHLVRAEKYRLTWQVRNRFYQGRDGYLTFAEGEHRMTLRHLLGMLALPFVTAFEATVGVLLRDRRAFPHAQNYYYERVLQRAATFGKLYERLRCALRSVMGVDE